MIWTQTSVAPVRWEMHDDLGRLVATVTKDESHSAPWWWRYDVMQEHPKAVWGLLNGTQRAKRTAEKEFGRRDW